MWLFEMKLLSKTIRDSGMRYNVLLKIDMNLKFFSRCLIVFVSNLLVCSVLKGLNPINTVGNRCEKKTFKYFYDILKADNWNY